MSNRHTDGGGMDGATMREAARPSERRADEYVRPPEPGVRWTEGEVRFGSGCLGFFVWLLVVCLGIGALDYDPWKKPERDAYGNEFEVQKKS